MVWCLNSDQTDMDINKPFVIPTCGTLPSHKCDMAALVENVGNMYGHVAMMPKKSSENQLRSPCHRHCEICGWAPIS